MLPQFRIAIDVEIQAILRDILGMVASAVGVRDNDALHSHDVIV